MSAQHVVGLFCPLVPRNCRTWGTVAASSTVMGQRISEAGFSQLTLNLSSVCNSTSAEHLVALKVRTLLQVLPPAPCLLLYALLPYSPSPGDSSLTSLSATSRTPLLFLMASGPQSRLISGTCGGWLAARSGVASDAPQRLGHFIKACFTRGRRAVHTTAGEAAALPLFASAIVVLLQNWAQLGGLGTFLTQCSPPRVSFRVVSEST